MALPRGFGIPVVAGEPLEFFSMVINKNEEDVPFDLKVRTTIEYTRDSELTEPVIPLFRRRLFNYVRAAESHQGHASQRGNEHAHHQGHADMAAIQTAAPADTAATDATLGYDRSGDQYTMHWMVLPGRHEYRNATGAQLRLPFDTTLHLVTGHLHPYAESIALVDQASGEEVVRLEAHAYTDRLGIADMDSFLSLPGILLAKDRQYELVTIYNNPTEGDIDAMGIVYLHLRDEGFARATPLAR